jgi:hypothetical protein
MNDRSKRSALKRPTKVREKPRAAKQRVQVAEWGLADERLDDALRQTFPASDALSIVQIVRGG